MVIFFPLISDVSNSPYSYLEAYLVCIFVYAHMPGCTWKLKDSLQESVLSFYHVDSRD